MRPHRSHRSGRDVDIGYVMMKADTEHRFARVNHENMNAEATWGLIEQLLATGAVESIFMAKSIQKQLVPLAAQTLSDAELRQIFSILEPDLRARKKTKIKVWRGHDDHPHRRG